MINRIDTSDNTYEKLFDGEEREDFGDNMVNVIYNYKFIY